MGKRARRRAREQGGPRAQRQPRAPLRVRLGADGTGDHLGSVVGAWVPLDPAAEFLALARADTPEALQRALLTPGRRTDTLCEDAVRAFRCAHAGDAEGLVEAVVLACTNHRWKGVSAPLLEALAEHKILDDGHVDQLAPAFLHQESVSLTAPGAWLDDWYLQKRDHGLRPLDPRKTYTLHRVVGPQLRRWAARQTVTDRDGVGPVLRGAQSLDSRHGAAVVLGLLDAADGLDADTAAWVLDVGLDWPSPSVRLPALKRLAAAGRHDEARERALRDRAAHIRRWGATRNQRPLLTDRGEPTLQADPRTPPLPCDRAAGASQPALFA